MSKAMLTLFTPIMLQQSIFYSTGVKFHITHIRKIMHQYGKRIFLPYTGRHESLVVYGTITENGNQLFRVYNKFNAVTFVEYLKELHWKYGKIAIILDRASVHKSKKVKEYLANNRDVKLIWLPKGSPYLNMIEQCWKISKYALLVSEYYAMFAIMNKAVSEYFRVTKFKLDVANYIFRNPAKMFANF